jgi:acyl-CoA synthetase (NDP forming)
VADQVRSRWIERLSSGEPFDELEGLACSPTTACRSSRAFASRTLETRSWRPSGIGFPVAVKTAAPGVQHKSDVGGVRLGVDDSPSLEDAYTDLERRLGPQVTVAPMVPAGVEIALGIVRDPQFGPLVLVGAGGVLGRGAEGPAPRDAAARRVRARRWSTD